MHKNIMLIFCVLISSNFMLQSASAARATAESGQLRREKSERIHIVWTEPEDTDADAIITCIGNYDGWRLDGMISDVVDHFHSSMDDSRCLPTRGAMFVSSDELVGVIGAIVVSSGMADQISASMEAVIPSRDNDAIFDTVAGRARMETCVQEILQHGLECSRTMTAGSKSSVCDR